MQPVIDADTHIAESEAMWQMIDGNMYPRRPVLLSLPDDTLYGGWNATWLIDGNIFPKPVGKGGFRLVTPSASKIQSNRRDIQIACRELTDVEARLADMDRGGIAAQVVYPTLFLIYLTDDAELDVALCRAYNRFMAQACAKSHDRIHWVTIPPLRCIEESVKELKWAKQNGAVGVFFRGMEGDLTLDTRTSSRCMKRPWSSIYRSAFTPAPEHRPSQRCSIWNATDSGLTLASRRCTPFAISC